MRVSFSMRAPIANRCFRWLSRHVTARTLNTFIGELGRRPRLQPGESRNLGDMKSKSP
jgi:hypothetical protein